MPNSRSQPWFEWLPLRKLTFLGLSFLAGCGASEEGTEHPAEIKQPLANVCAAGETLRGVDVSKYDKTVDWTKVRNAGIAFAIARTNDGHSIDPYFATNWREIRRAGLIRGAYQFFEDFMSGEEQADLMIQMMGTLEPDDLPPVLDIEGASLTSTVPLATKHSRIRDWISRVESRTGRRPIVYTGPSFWKSEMKSLDLRPVPLWVAHYGVTCPTVPAPWTNWLIHQSSSSGQIDGMPVRADTDIFNGSKADLLRFIANSNIDGGTSADGGAPEGGGHDGSVDADAGWQEPDSGGTPIFDGAVQEARTETLPNSGESPPDSESTSGSCRVAWGSNSTPSPPWIALLALGWALGRTRRKD